MIKAILPAVLIVLLLTIGSGWSAEGPSLDLSQFKWKNRLLLLFAPHRGHPFFDNLHQAIMNRKGEVEDRDLVIFEMFEKEPSTVNGDDLDPQTRMTLRKQFNVQRGEFAVILIGKDGGVKLNRREQTELEDIFGLIDAMPMRREEMRRKSLPP